MANHVNDEAKDEKESITTEEAKKKKMKIRKRQAARSRNGKKA
ncbi:hypothetical protein QS257_08645 [Terrilactibacillus sp. S3-3]|nr:hypothetical protein QS257_08645 [Terrilactibacillus sp. S3-3]